MLFSKETLKAFAGSKGIVLVDDEAYRVLGQDLEYRLKELCQESSKFMLASCRTKLHVSDVNNALISKNIEPLFGYESRDVLVFRGIPTGSFYIQDDEIDIEEFLEKPLPKIPLRPYIQSHWLAVEGFQPPIQQNPIIIEKPETKTDDFSTYQEEMQLKKQVKHRLTKELHLYFEKIIKVSETDPSVAMECFQNETGIQQLVPYFIYHFNISLKENIANEEKVKIICMMFYSLLKNKFLFIDPYLHEIIPSIITCIVGKSVTESVRYLATDILVFAYQNYADIYQSLGPRTVNTLIKTYEDNSKTEDSQFASLYALSKLSKETIKPVLDKPCSSKYQKVIDFYNSLK